MTTTITIDDIVELGRQSSLTTAILTDWAERGTPKQREYLHGLLAAEVESRQASRRHRLLRAAKLPALKSFDGYDWTAIHFPTDYGRQPLIDLEFLDHAQDLVLYGDVGTGKTHLAIALAAAACHQGYRARYFTTAALVMHLRRAKDDNRLDKELASLARNHLLILDEFGYLPIDAEGARLLSKSSPMAMSNAAWSSPPTWHSPAGAPSSVTTPWPPPSSTG